MDDADELARLMETLQAENERLTKLVDQGAMSRIKALEVENAALRERVHALTQEKADAVRSNALLKQKLNKITEKQ